MDWRAWIIGGLIGCTAVGACARQRGPLLSASDRAALARPSAAPEPSRAPEDASSDVDRAKSDLQSQVLLQQSRIAELTTQLQNNQGNLAAERGIVESQSQKEQAFRQQQMQELAASIRQNDDILQFRSREFNFNLGPTGTFYEGNEYMNSLQNDVNRLQARGIELRSAYASLSDENQSAIEQSTAIQERLVADGRRQQSDLAASLTQAQSELARLQQQSRELEPQAKK